MSVRAFLDWCSRRRFIPGPFYADAFDLARRQREARRQEGMRKKHGIAFWSPAEAVQWVELARAESVHREAQVLLMLNGGMGATDLANLEDVDVDWERKCIHTDRSKTLVPRVIPLWPETLEAMRKSRATRAEPADAKWSHRFFLTRRGYPLVFEQLKPGNAKLKRSDTIKNWFYLMMNGDKARAAKVPHLKRRGAGAYTLRSIFTTLTLGHGGDANLEAVILGQQFGRPVLEFYIRGTEREKLVALVDHVHKQLWPHL
jgi:integrase